MAAIVTIGIDLAKNVFAVHVGDFGAESQVLAVSDCTSAPCRRITAAATAASARSST